MFTGIVTDVGTVIGAQQRGDLRLRIRTGYDLATVDLGASIACSGGDSLANRRRHVARRRTAEP